MKKLLIPSIFFMLLISFSFAQKPYKVVFYNLENFFDTINDPEVLDDEFTPDGPKKWNTAKYNKTRPHTDGFQRNNAKCLDEKGISRFVPHSSF